MIDYDNPWVFEGKPFTEPPKGTYGFVYRITNLETNKMYIGRKYFWSKRKTKKSTRRVTKESDWKDYYGSCKPLLEDVKSLGKEKFKREIISLHETKGQTNYKEVALQFIEDVLYAKDSNGNRRYYNDNILSRYFSPKN